jgi:XTP/dITP diphosphohydrolase
MLSEFPDAPEPVEDACTFKGNALIKARSAADHTGLWTVADDSGLTVAWLGGRPGVLSARYCGGHGDDVANNLKVLAEMAGAPEMLRGARFVAAVAIAAPGGNRTAQHVDACRTWVVEGECHGVIAHEMRGSGGFGYDSLFFVSRLEKTFAELSAAEKDALSHRGKAFAKARVLLAGLCVQ